MLANLPISNLKLQNTICSLEVNLLCKEYLYYIHFFKLYLVDQMNSGLGFNQYRFLSYRLISSVPLPFLRLLSSVPQPFLQLLLVFCQWLLDFSQQLLVFLEQQDSTMANFLGVQGEDSIIIDEIFYFLYRHQDNFYFLICPTRKNSNQYVSNNFIQIYL